LGKRKGLFIYFPVIWQKLGEE